MSQTLRKILLLISLGFVVAGVLAGCGGGGSEDPDLDGPEWEGACPPPAEMKGLIEASIRDGYPVPPFEQYCPAEYAEMQRLK